MLKKKVKLLFIVLVSFSLFLVLSMDSNVYVCGIATGFPPYQFQNEKGETTGIDYEIAKLLFETAGLKVKFAQDKWDTVMFDLAHNTGKIDLLCGAEISDERKALFDFSDSYYKRHIVLFTLKNSPINKISDLFGKLITGDRHSFFEKYLGESKGQIRIMETASKEESFQKLKDGEVVAVIAPEEVGYYISKNMKLDVKVLEEKDPGSPVAFAVAKGNDKLLAIINTALRKLVKEGKVDEIIKKYK